MSKIALTLQASQYIPEWMIPCENLGSSLRATLDNRGRSVADRVFHGMDRTDDD